MSTSVCSLPRNIIILQIGAVWLRKWVARVGGSGSSSSSGGGSGDSELGQAVVRILLTAKSGDEAAAHLFDLLGDGAFEAMQELLENRSGFCWGMST
jgi:hypothetical protein